ncbi:MAG: lysophospholipid acyltransferase family protein [Myxococcaceae bacterium]
MRAVYSVACWVWVFLTGVFLNCLGLVLFIPFNPLVDPKRRVMEWVNGLWGKAILAPMLKFHLRVSGLERVLSTNEPYLICANHASVCDIIMLLAAWPYFKFITKPAVFYFPPLLVNVRLAGYIKAARGEDGGSERVLADCIRTLNRGNHVLVFPEGTRSPTDKTIRFRQGPFVIAQKAGVKVLPVAISGTHRVLPKGSFWYDFATTVNIDFLEPFVPAGEPKTVAATTRKIIDAQMEKRARELAALSR